MAITDVVKLQTDPQISPLSYTVTKATPREAFRHFSTISVDKPVGFTINEAANPHEFGICLKLHLPSALAKYSIKSMSSGLW